MQQASSSIDIRLKKTRYIINDFVEGWVIVRAYGSWTHHGIHLGVQGSVELDSQIKPIPLMNIEIEIAPSGGRIHEGVTEIPFELRLASDTLYPTYHGVFINVSYILSVDCDRGVIKKSLTHSQELLVETAPTLTCPPSVRLFTITPETLENVREASFKAIPNFRISGRLDRTTCPVTEPLTGEVVIEEAERSIQSIELQLVRVESIRSSSGQHEKNSTEIQNIQIAEGDVCRNQAIPLYTVLPRLFTCASLKTSGFGIQFEVNLIVLFDQGQYAITETFPITLL